MFGGGGGNGDPLRNPFEQMHHQMRQMDNLMNGNAMLGDAFDMLNSCGMGMPRHPMLGEGLPQNTRQVHGNRFGQYNDNMMMTPFGFGFGAPLFGGMMQQMQSFQNRAMDDPNSMVISESTMISYGGDGQPKVVQSSTRKAGNVKETRRALRDGQREEMSVGHTIGDKSHILEKKRDKNGRIRQQQKFINLNEDEAADFNEQFKSQARDNLSNFGLFGGRNNRHHAIENGKHFDTGNMAKGRGIGASSSYQHKYGQTSTPIITVPDDDEEDEPRRSRSGRNRRQDDDEDIVYLNSNSGTGPTIQEIDEHDNTDSATTNPKRRKGVFKFLG